MNVRNKIGSGLFFLLVSVLPFLKVFLLGEFDSAEQSKYIRFYFWLQFLIPVIDFGFYWSLIRRKVSSGIDINSFYGFSALGLLLGLVALPFDLILSQLLFLAVFVSWYNCNLQILRIDGDSSSYYRLRIFKVTLDLFFVSALYSVGLISVSLLLFFELVAILLVGVFFWSSRTGTKDIFLFGLDRLFTLDYFYTVIKVLRANIARLLVPLIFVSQGIESVLFAVLFYELLAQFISVEKLKDLLAGKVRVFACLLGYLLTLPIQYLGIALLSHMMGWGFGSLEVLCVMFGGASRLFSIYTLNVVKNNAFDILVYLNVFLVCFAVAEVYSIQQFSAVEYPAQIALLIFYGAEALIGLGLIIWLEQSRLFKRK